MKLSRIIRDQRGIALITVVLVALAVSSVAIAASMMTMSGTLVRRYSERATIADQAAISGTEKGLSALLGNGALYPQTGFTTLADSLPVYDANGTAIPGVRRSIYLGPSVDPARGSIVTQVWGQGGVRAVRRLEVSATSLGSYGFFVDDDETGLGYPPQVDQYGPVYSRKSIQVQPPSVGDTTVFWDQVATASTVINSGNGIFRQGFKENVPVIPMPSSTDLTSLRPLAVTAGLQFASTGPGPNSAPMRIEFVPVDMDGDTATKNDIEGFIRIFTTNDNSGDRAYVIAGVKDSLMATPNCGEYDEGEFKSLANGKLSGSEAHSRFDNHEFHCYLGGDITLNDSTWTGTIGPGTWIPYTGPAISSPGFDATPGKQFLHPYTPALNSNSAGVIYVDGDVAVSGVVVGKVTVASADDIIIVDDLVQYHDPAANACNADLIGLFAQDDIVIADNTINTPQRYGTQNYQTMGATKDEFVQAVILALDEFRVHNALSGPDALDNGGAGAEQCEGTPQGRGCLYLTGGIIEKHRGRIGSASSGTGPRLRQSYNSCVRTGAPPQFPVTGKFTKGSTYEIDPANFDPATWFANYQS